ncbi:signal peptidase I [Nakamurella sp. GG22]
MSTAPVRPAWRWPAGRVSGWPVTVRRVLFGALWAVMLAVAVLAWPVLFGGLTGYTIVSGRSMEPAYHGGDLLITRSQQRYQVGQIVVYTVPAGEPGAGYKVVHRLIGGSGAPNAAGWTTKGDNNSSEDPWTPHDSDIQGAVQVNVSYGGIVLLQARNPLLYCFLGALAVGRILWPKPDRGTAAPRDSPRRS